ncbi:translocation/assembly module TamB [Natronospirillum operosum]|uniref:Translocation/assembly module TamB n=1 Tax=Natronospirillum operosum TaxID=2759953 RepID=A0A4Z0WBV7_9GAMM|nr:translocation/assembly module TamB [Natronospirillum operosum]TGG92365.1 translocation/assembly module TamB [Natronospirillum operosum]
MGLLWTAIITVLGRALRRLALMLLVTAALLTVVLVLALGTSTGRVWIAHQGLLLAHTQLDWTIDISGLSSPALTEWQAERIRVFPPGMDEAAIRVDDLNVRYPLNQWELAFTIESLTARRVTVDLERLRQIDPGPPREEPPLTEVPDPIELSGFGIWLDHLEIDELRLVDAQGDALSGRMHGALAWPELNRLPVLSLDWQDEEQDLLRLAAQPSPDGQRWLLNGDLTLPPGTWAHELTQWPADEALSARMNLVADLPGQALQIQEIAFPWQGHAIELSGNVAHDRGIWSLHDILLQVDERESWLEGHLGPEGARFEGALNLPVSLVRPFLPDAVADHTLDPEDILTAELLWPEDGRWTLLAGLTTRWHEQPARISLDARGQMLAVDVVDAVATVGDSRLHLNGYWHLGRHQGALDVNGRIAGDIAAPYWQDALFTGGELSGTLTGQGHDDQGAINWPQWQGTLTAGGQLDTNTGLGTLPWTGTAEAEFIFPHLTWEQLSLSLNTGPGRAQIDSAGSYDLDSRQLDLDWQLNDVPVAPIADAFMDWPEDLTATLSGTGSVAGPVVDLTGEAHLEGRGQWHGSNWEARLDAPLLSANQALLEDFSLQWRDSRIQASGSLRPESGTAWQDWTGQLDVAPLEISFADARVALPDWPEQLTEGRIVSSLSARGRLGDPTVLAQARLNAQYQGSSLTGSFNWQADQLQADLNWQDRFVTLEGQGRPWEQGRWQVRAERLHTDDLSPWMELPPELLAADLTHRLDLVVEGHLTEAEIQLQTHHQGRWEDDPLSARSDLTLQWADGAPYIWTLHDLGLDWGSARLRASGSSREGDWLPELLDVSLNDFPLHTFLPAPDDFHAYLSGDANLDARWPEWGLDVQLAIEGEQAAQALTGRIDAQASGRDLEPERIELTEMDVRMGDGLEITGSGGFSDNLWDLALDWRGLQWAPPTQASAGGPTIDTPWTGSGALRLSGEGDDPDIQAHTEWSTRWEAQGDQETLELAFGSQLYTTDDAISLTSSLSRPGRNLMELGVEMPREPWLTRLDTPWEEWTAEAFWSIDLRGEETLYWLGQDQWQIAGDFSGQGHVTGALGNPDIDGNLSWEDGSIRFPDVGAELDRIQLNLAATNLNEITVDGSARAGDGTVDVGGSLGLENGTLYSDLQLDLDQAALLQRPDIQSLASGQLTLTGDWPDLLLAGDLRLIGLTVNINRLAGPSVAQLEIHNEQNGNGLNGDIPLALDIGIRTDGVATIRGMGLDARLSGELRIGGTLAELQSDGALTIESGTFNLLARQFQLQEGQVRLIDESIDLYIVAVHQRGDVMIEATITGNAEQLQLALRSEPSLPEDEIVAQLLFGKTVQNMTPWQALQLANAINQLRGGDSLDLLMATRDTLGLDTLEIEAGEEEGEAATLRVGRYLNSRVYLEVDTDLNEDRDWAGTIEVELTPNLNLETRTGSGGRSGGLELRWRRDY